MLRNHATFNIGNAGQFVNGVVTTLLISMVAVSYFAALGRFVVA
ncbi:MAG: hypothetical protein U5J99_13595 [Parvularculaceae bacterium]|nr:hypothetical protein [Parvularculaceae bacterium]